MRNTIAALFLLAAVGPGCKPTGIFGRKSPHEEYVKKLDKTDMEETPEGRQWLAASKTALEDAQVVELPYRQNGYFGSDRPRALGLKFNARHGEQLNFMLTKRSSVPFTLYVDIFKQEGEGTSLVYSADTIRSQFSYYVEEAGNYIVRLQPELFRSGAYSLSASIGPSIGFPVSGNKVKTGSFWGASRGGGNRQHEGIDIFAPKRTPVVAAADGIVTGVKEGGLGGKVVWLKLPDKNITLYYAHLDKQLVREGQEVKKGETLGLVGNTGNAKHTASHLHFGVYTSGGPIDPFPFVNPTVKTAPAVPDKNMTNYLRVSKTQKIANGSNMLQANTLLIPLAANLVGYIAEMPDGKLVQVPFASVESISQPVRSMVAVAESSEKERKRRVRN
ncbi:M23 family metallopeptidase [Chitinophagaceae bacterium LB-8]|uniref:M23 family metallopeptidase n=1 Tax=Paraflavisolibacter caeni TaxID=2982496 RepID=A0A9X2XPR3_9BACT|nr:M23 family metallopeptidase [Paraflavisolibacter caeni]MCU7551983.1 M23 family metallopeptidase [Paraflavisolibacter caeni]